MKLFSNRQIQKFTNTVQIFVIFEHTDCMNSQKSMMDYSFNKFLYNFEILFKFNDEIYYF